MSVSCYQKAPFIVCPFFTHNVECVVINYLTLSTYCIVLKTYIHPVIAISPSSNIMIEGQPQQQLLPAHGVLQPQPPQPQPKPG